MCIILKNTPEKYEKMMDELAPPLFKLLKELDSLEKEIFERNREMDKEKPLLNIPSHIIHPKWHELIDEYRTRFGEIIDKSVSNKLKSRGFANSIGSMSRYCYVQNGEFTAEFTMRKDDVANIVTHFKRSSEMKHKFVLRLIDGVWLVDEKYYGFEDEKAWHTDSI